MQSDLSKPVWIYFFYVQSRLTANSSSDYTEINITVAMITVDMLHQLKVHFSLNKSFLIFSYSLYQVLGFFLYKDCDNCMPVQQSTIENLLCFASFLSLLFKSEADKVSRSEGQRKLNRHIIFESVLMLCAKNYQN